MMHGASRAEFSQVRPGTMRRSLKMRAKRRRRLIVRAAKQADRRGAYRRASNVTCDVLLRSAPQPLVWALAWHFTVTSQ
eukprot:scaffold482312_cov44-Prasinocladus_malaysianus.AAC.2